MGGFTPKPPAGMSNFTSGKQPGGNRPSSPLQQQRDLLNQRMDRAARAGNNDHVHQLMKEYDALEK